MFPSILIVDDEPSILQSLGGLLSDEGFEVTTAVNGYEALKTIDEESPDLVLLDIWMPGIDGLSLIERGRPASPHTTFIVMTAFATIDTAVKAIKLGAESYLTKPLELEAVIALVDRALDLATQAGIARTVVNVHYLAERIERHLATRDVAISDDEILHVVNPGMRRVEAFSFDGELQSFWGRAGAGGCRAPTV